VLRLKLGGEREEEAGPGHRDLFMYWVLDILVCGDEGKSWQRLCLRQRVQECGGVYSVFKGFTAMFSLP
jgi:hypothetical protein